MDKDYLIEVGVVEDSADEVNTTAAEYLRTIDETTAIVDGLAANWEGETYQTFRDGYYSHLDKLIELNQSLTTLAGDLYTNTENARAIIRQAREIMK